MFGTGGTWKYFPGGYACHRDYHQCLLYDITMKKEAARHTSLQIIEMYSSVRSFEMIRGV